MNKILEYDKAKDKLLLKEKIAQFFMPAAFINDTEEEIQALETLIRDHGIGGICFFHSRASAATNYEGKKEVVWNDKSFETLVEKAKSTTDLKRRTALYEKAQEVFKQEVPWVTVAHATVFKAMSPKVKGYQISPFGTEDFTKIELK